ncbi:MAG: HAD hydrolase-like protein [Candidatus Daviesbacteria bacterium]
MEKEGIRVIITDWDDTCVDTFNPVVVAVRDFGIAYDLPVPSLDNIEVLAQKLREYWGVRIANQFAEIWPGFNAEELERKYLAFIKECHLCPEPFPGVIEAINKLQKMVQIVGVVSSGVEAVMKESLNFHFSRLERPYDFFYGRESCPVDYSPGKFLKTAGTFNPAFKLLNKVGLNEEVTAYIGDSSVDFQASKERGIEVFLGVLTGHTTRDKFLELGLEDKFIIPSLAQVPERLEELKLVQS